MAHDMITNNHTYLESLSCWITHLTTIFTPSTTSVEHLSDVMDLSLSLMNVSCILGTMGKIASVYVAGFGRKVGTMLNLF